MPGQRRGKYRQPSDEERRAIIDAHVSGDKYVAVAARLQIKRGTAWSIVARYLRTGEVVCEQRGGAQHHRLDNENLLPGEQPSADLETDGAHPAADVTRQAHRLHDDNFSCSAWRVHQYL